ncbi:hypothetical protein IFT48_03445 [Pseudomonas fluorescens]|uniref:hypothetical protein n=1 Tax=Pseudomonas TaxID=286 RepID=UPI000F03FBDC|nr:MULTISPECIES: hypothetical protein [Pseudomonas]MBD8089024.1 hypothetical protein [Pseudomonas fluorescens]MBD8615545.1 hypothetical protein [Pseudomonas putida]MBD8681803.1 hypothetical protein [Pseudomonas sp. CFBP 13719]
MLRIASNWRLALSSMLMAFALLSYLPVASADWKMDLISSTVGRKVIKAIVIHEGKAILEGAKSKALANLETKVRQNPWLAKQGEKSLSEILRTRKVHETYSAKEIADLKEKFQFRKWSDEGVVQNSDF